MLALIAGQGELPNYLVGSLDEKPLVAALEGFPPDNLEATVEFRIEQIGSFLKSLLGQGVTEVCFAGSVRRPALDPTKIDAETLPFVPRMMDALQQGDDAALRIVLGFFEEAGIAIRAAHEIAPRLLAEAGTPTTLQPSEQGRSDAKRAAQIQSALGSVDVGQAVVVHRGQALALESVHGTDWMLGTLRGRERGGLLFKGPKPDQDRRVDMPTIGPRTVQLAFEAGLDGIVTVEGGVLLIDRERVIQLCDELGLYLWVRDQ